MNMITCPNCGIVVLPKADGTCPSCQVVIVKGEKGTRNKEDEPANEKPKQRRDSRQSSKESHPSYGLGVAILIVAVAIELIGRAIVASIRASASGQGFRDVLITLNGAMAIQGTFDVIMVVLFIIGIILLVRTFWGRKKASKS
jgi:uncharacterized Zn finger protein (UPF0148 family)